MTDVVILGGGNIGDVKSRLDMAETLIAERIGSGHYDDNSHADNDAQEFVLVHLRHNAACFSRRLTDYLNAHCDEFEEYNPVDNPLNHCMLYGGIVQIF